MSYNIRLTTNADKIADDFDNFVDSLNENLNTAVDGSLNTAVQRLKSRLFSVINSEVTTTGGITTESEDKTRQVESTVPEVKKSDKEIIKALTGFDLEKFDKTKDYTSMVESKVVMHFSNSSRGGSIDNYSKNPEDQSIVHPMSSGLNFRIPMDVFDTFDSQYQKAKSFYNDSIFAFEKNGKINYYLNPGIDLSNYVKVVCSTDTGDTEKSREKFSTTWQEKGFADWSLKREAIDVIKNEFIKLDDVVSDLKEGNFEDAREKVNFKVTRQNKAQEINDKVNKFEDGSQLDQDTQSYRNIVTLIKNLSISKRTSGDTITYTLVTTYGSGEGFLQFLYKARIEIGMWITENQEKWFNSILRAIEKSLTKYDPAAKFR